MKKILIFLLFFASLTASFASGLYPDPAAYSWRTIIKWGQPKIASGAALPAVDSASEGDIFFLATTTPVLYRFQSGAWAMSSGGSSSAVDSSASLTAHIAKTINPHGASMSVDTWLRVGTGTPDTFIDRVSTGTVGIASYIWIPPEVATPTNPASFTIWGNANTGKVQVFDGTTWQNLW